FLRARLMAAVVKQKFADAFRLDARAIDQLLTAQLPAITDSTKPALADFLDSAFASSNPALTITRAAFGNQFDAFVRLQKVATLVTGLNLTSTQLGWLRDYGAQAGWLDLKALPLSATSATMLFDTWLRLVDLSVVRDHIRGKAATLADIFALASDPSSTADAV